MEISYRSGGNSALWSGGVQRVYLFFGEEDRLKYEAVEALIAYAVEEENQDFDLERLDASTAGADAILSSAGQIPFMATKRVTLVRGMEGWRDRNKQGECERLAEGIAKLGDTACLILVAAAEEEEGKRKTAVTVKLDNAAKKFGAVVICEGLKGEALAKWVSERVRHYGKKITPAASLKLVQAAGEEMTLLENEILKLVCYMGEDAQIDERAVSEVTSTSPEDEFFATVDAICKKQTDLSLKLLAELHRYDPKPQAVAGKLLALIGRQFRMLWPAKFLSGKRVPPRSVRQLPPELASELPTESNIVQLAFKAGDLFTMSEKFSWDSLTRAFELLLFCDLANKGNTTDEVSIFGNDPTINLQLLVVAISALR